MNIEKAKNQEEIDHIFKKNLHSFQSFLNKKSKEIILAQIIMWLLLLTLPKFGSFNSYSLFKLYEYQDFGQLLLNEKKVCGLYQ